MGKRQRHTEFIGLSNEQLLALIRNPNTSKETRRKAVAEAKFRRLRNVQKKRTR